MFIYFSILCFMYFAFFLKIMVQTHTSYVIKSVSIIFLFKEKKSYINDLNDLNDFISIEQRTQILYSNRKKLKHFTSMNN